MPLRVTDPRSAFESGHIWRGLTDFAFLTTIPKPPAFPINISSNQDALIFNLNQQRI
jgi:hypothetical protein